MVTCSSERPWGVHAAVRSDEDCPRCGWTAPGPLGDALEAAGAGRARAAELGWTVHDGGAEALAA
jgi:hypothetical protein